MHFVDPGSHATTIHVVFFFSCQANKKNVKPSISFGNHTSSNLFGGKFGDLHNNLLYRLPDLCTMANEDSSGQRIQIAASGKNDTGIW